MGWYSAILSSPLLYGYAGAGIPAKSCSLDFDPPRSFTPGVLKINRLVENFFYV